tara:strand:- start:20070 stop:20405 length:336 start_codon:yes stop_codon:yes gene_type:complete
MKNLFLILIAFLFFFYGVCYSQVSVIHFNSEWNADNNFDISVLKDCDTTNVIICDNEDLKEKYKIIAVPTIIIFDEGDEVVRFEGNIMMVIKVTKKELQKEIDKVIMAKFQ